MELKEIQQLIKFVSSSGVDEVEIEQKDFKLSIKKTAKTETITVAAPPQIQAQVPSIPQAMPAAPAAPAPQAQDSSAAAPEASADDKLVAIKSPMIGTFYRSPSPDKPPFINVGDNITKGQVSCIIEAMKLFNEIESEIEGKVVKVLVDDATPVEYDQPLFLIEVK
jgi:acetyl-CoA carboxylase biotin carboxyl carrier protein